MRVDDSFASFASVVTRRGSFFKINDELYEYKLTSFQTDIMMNFLKAFFLNWLNAFKNFTLMNVSSSWVIASLTISSCQCFMSWKIITFRNCKRWMIWVDRSNGMILIWSQYSINSHVWCDSYSFINNSRYVSFCVFAKCLSKCFNHSRDNQSFE